MRLLYLSDRLSRRGGADLHLRQVMAAAVSWGHDVTLAVGRVEADAAPPAEVQLAKIRGLASPTASQARLAGLDDALAQADRVHAQNVMNPVALARIAANGKAVVTVQDHRIFCPGEGRTLPDGQACDRAMGPQACAECLPDPDYRARTLELTAARRDALRGARLVVLSAYMARELAEAGLPDALIIPPWVEVSGPKGEPGSALLLGGRLVRHKGVRLAWEAWQLAGRAMPLRVAGAGPLEGSLGGAECLGWLESAALGAELRRARALLFPARWQEPFGILGVEALAQGTPVIVAEAGGTSDWSEAGCLRVPAGDVAAMAEAIETLTSDSDRAEKMGEAGRRFVQARFSEARIAPLLQRVYD